MSATPTRRRALRGLPVPSPSPSRAASVSSKAAEKWASALTYHSGRRDFYTAFERAPPAPTAVATKKKGRLAKQAPEPAVFDVGDTVLIRVERGLPAVGVVVEMWERLSDADAAAAAGGGDALGPAVGEEADEEPGERYVRVKWFQRVKELPSMMANRLRVTKSKPKTKGEPETQLDPETQLYYASFDDVHHEFSPPLPTALVIAHCTVSDQPRELDVVRVGGAHHARVTVSEATVDIPAVAGSFQQGKLSIPALYWCAGIADSTTGKAWGFGDCEGPHRARTWQEFQAEALQAATKKGRKAWSTGRQKEKPKPPPAAKPPVKQNFRKVVPVASPSKKAQRSPSKGRKKVPAPSAHVDDADEVAAAEASASSDDDRGSDARPSSEESEADSDEGDVESDAGATESDGDDDDDDEPAPGRGRKRKARAGPGGSPSKKRGRSAGGSKKEAAARQAHAKKVQKTLKRLRAPKSRPMQDVADQPLPTDPYQRALHLLHVGATPESLPCREEQYADVLVKIEGVIEGGGGGCIYISGQPGTGKTATVHAVVRELKQKARDMELPPFEYVEINGLKIPDPGHAYVVLWEALAGLSPDIEYAASDDEGGGGGGKGGKGRSVSAKTALRGLEAHFGTGQGRSSKIGGPRRTTYVVLMDELDQLFTAKQDVVYNFFNWPTLPNSQLIVIAVANTMDMPEKLAGRVKSRMGMERINFPPYSKDQLVEIAQSRLIPHPSPPPGLANDDYQVIEKDALTLAAAKTTGVTGDARRMLDVCRRAVEVSLSTYAASVAPGTGTPRRSTKPQPVKMKQILTVLTEMSRNPTAQFVRSCSLYEKVMLAAVVRGIRKTGVGEIEWGRIKLDHSLLLSSLTNLPPFRTRLLASEYSVILASLVASYALSVATITGNGGAANVVEDRRKVGLGSGMDESEVGRVLRNLQGEIGGEAKWTGMF